MSQLLTLLSSQPFWAAVLSVVLGVVFVPGGVAQNALTALCTAASNWLQRRLPANQYALVMSLAHIAVAAAAQEGAAYSWTNAEKKQQALAGLTAVVKQHGITRFNATTLDDVIEKVYNEVKATLAATSVPALQAPISPTVSPVAGPVVPTVNAPDLSGLSSVVAPPMSVSVTSTTPSATAPQATSAVTTAN